MVRRSRRQPVTIHAPYRTAPHRTAPNHIASTSGTKSHMGSVNWRRCLDKWPVTRTAMRYDSIRWALSSGNGSNRSPAIIHTYIRASNQKHRVTKWTSSSKVDTNRRQNNNTRDDTERKACDRKDDSNNIPLWWLYRFRCLQPFRPEAAASVPQPPSLSDVCRWPRSLWVFAATVPPWRSRVVANPS